MLSRFNHTANAELVASITGGNLRFDLEGDKWYLWASGDWQEEKYVDEHIRKAASYREACIDAVPDLQKKEARAWANNSFNMYHIRETKAAMERMEKFAFPTQNNALMLFKAGSQVIDLTTLHSRESTRADGLLFGSSIEFDGDAESPIWDKAIRDAFHDPEMTHYFQKVVGYLLTGETKEQVFFHLVGVPGSGKSKIVEVLNQLLGAYSHSTDFRVFAKTRMEGAVVNHGLAPMRGKRLVTTGEPSDGSKWDDKTIKTITGEDVITCRYLNKEEFQYTPQFKVVVMSNKKLHTDDLSGAFDRRYIPIPFDVSYTEDPGRIRDWEIGNKFKAELPGILNWALIGCHNWQKEGLRPIPVAIREGKLEQKVENRAAVYGGVAQFADDCLIKSNLVRTSNGEIYKGYLFWAESIRMPQKDIIGSSARVSEILKDLGFMPHRSSTTRGFMAEIVTRIPKL